MGFRIALAGALPDLAEIGSALRNADPAALLDVDRSSHSLRVATSVGAIELVSLLGRAGFPVRGDQVTQLPSVCCGGCGG